MALPAGVLIYAMTPSCDGWRPGRSKVVAAGNEDVPVVSHDWGMTLEERHVFPGRDYVGEPYRDTSHHWLAIECVRCLLYPPPPHPTYC
jgi:hypothetical protein